MQIRPFPVIDPVATGNNIRRLRTERGMTVREMQAYFGFEQPQAIYKWQQGTSLPSVDNLYALGALLEVPMDEILVSAKPTENILKMEQQGISCCSVFIQMISAPKRSRQAARTASAFCCTRRSSASRFPPEKSLSSAIYSSPRARMDG